MLVFFLLMEQIDLMKIYDWKPILKNISKIEPILYSYIRNFYQQEQRIPWLDQKTRWLPCEELWEWTLYYESWCRDNSM